MRQIDLIIIWQKLRLGLHSLARRKQWGNEELASDEEDSYLGGSGDSTQEKQIKMTLRSLVTLLTDKPTPPTGQRKKHVCKGSTCVSVVNKAAKEAISRRDCSLMLVSTSVFTLFIFIPIKYLGEITLQRDIPLYQGQWIHSPHPSGTYFYINWKTLCLHHHSTCLSNW